MPNQWGVDYNGDIYAAIPEVQQILGRKVGKALFDEMPVEWGGSSAAIHILDEMIAVSPEYVTALGAARDTYQSLKDGNEALVNAQLLQDAQDFATLYAITGVTVLASGALATGISVAGLTGSSAVIVGAGGEAAISVASGVVTDSYAGKQITAGSVGYDALFGAITGGIGGRILGGPRAVVAERGVISGVDASTLARSHAISGRASRRTVNEIADSMRSQGYVGDAIKVVVERRQNDNC